METTRIIGISFPGGHMTVGITETELQIMQQLMEEEMLETYQAYRKMREIVRKKK